MAKGEWEQASGKQARKATSTNEKKPKRPPGAGEAQVRKGAGKAEGTKAKNTAGVSKAGARPGVKRSNGKKPGGTNVNAGGGTAAKGSKLVLEAA